MIEKWEGLAMLISIVSLFALAAVTALYGVAIIVLVISIDLRDFFSNALGVIFTLLAGCGLLSLWWLVCNFQRVSIIHITSRMATGLALGAVGSCLYVGYSFVDHGNAKHFGLFGYTVITPVMVMLVILGFMNLRCGCGPEEIMKDG